MEEGEEVERLRGKKEGRTYGREGRREGVCVREIEGGQKKSKRIKRQVVFYLRDCRESNQDTCEIVQTYTASQSSSPGGLMKTGRGAVGSGEKSYAG